MLNLLSLARQRAATLTGARFLASLAVGLASIAMSLGLAFRSPSIVAPVRLIFEDSSILFTATELLSAGRALYRDIFYQYGPLALFPYALFTWIAGNSPLAFWFFSTALCGLNCCLLTYLLARHIRPLFASLIVLILFLPTSAGPPRLLIGPPYQNIETTLLLLIALTWQPASERSSKRSLLVGCLIGLVQLVKFGSNVVALIGVVIVDVLESRSRKRPIRDPRLLAAWGYIAAGHLLVTSLFFSWLRSFLPASDRWRILWPSFMQEAYRTFSVATGWYQGYFQHFDIRMALRFQLPLILALIVATIAIYFAVVHRTMHGHGRSFWGIALFPVWFGVGTISIYKHIYLVHLYSVFVLLALALGQGRKTLERMALAALLLLAAFGGINATRTVLSSGNGMVPLHTPQGSVLWGTPADVTLFGRLLGLAAERRPVTVIGAFGQTHVYPGLYFFGRTLPTTRYLWFAPGIIPRGDLGKTASRIASGRLLVVALPPDAAGADLATAIRRAGIFEETQVRLISDAFCATRIGEKFLVAEPCSRGAPKRDA